MKVFILTEGGKDIGFGHITRCLSLCQAFEERGIAPEFMVKGDDTVKDLLSGREYRVFDWPKEENDLFGMIKDASSVIVDSYLAGRGFYKRISESVNTPVFIDDNKRIDYPKGILVNSGICAEEINYPERKDITYLLGPEYIPIRKEFWDAGRKETKDDIESIMVTFGGDDIRGMTPKVLNLLKEHYPEIRKNVIIGMAFRSENLKEAEKAGDKKTFFFRGPGADKVKEIMLGSDIAISAGGQTLYEFARTGLPAIGICVTDNQEGNLTGWSRKSFVKYIGRYDDSGLTERLKEAIEGLKDARIRNDMSKAGKDSVDGRGSRRVVKAVLSDVFKNSIVLRNAAFDDAADIFALSNDEAVRRGSFHSEKIRWEDHLKWLKERLDDGDHAFFIAAKDDMFCGQIRFDVNREKGEAIVSISLIEEMRGLDLAPFLLKRSIDELLAANNDVRSVKAYMKEENAPSIRAFERAGFRFSENTTVNASKARVYIRKVDYVNA